MNWNDTQYQGSSNEVLNRLAPPEPEWIGLIGALLKLAGVWLVGFWILSKLVSI